MRKITSSVVALVAAFLVLGCDPDEASKNNSGGNDVTDEQFMENFGSAVSRDFIGQIVDANNDPIENATVKIGSSIVQTDVNGVFMIDGAQVHEKFAYIKASKAGFVDGSRALVPTSGKNNVKIMLLRSGALETVQSGEASEVSIYSGTKVKFDGAFEDENGVPYSGSVGVFMFHLTSSDEHLSELQPGMLYAETESGDEAVLQTFGMMNVELRGSGGQKLQIAEGHNAEITMRIDDSQLASAPNSIPLWHFDENAGWWKEEGSATRNGNYYVGEVSHFSWWNCDVSNQLVNLIIHVVDSNGASLQNATVFLTSPNSTSCIQAVDSEGYVSGLVPANTALTASVGFPYCGNWGYMLQQAVPPLSADGSVTIVVPATEYTSFNVTGKLVTCGGSPVNGYVMIGVNGVGGLYYAPAEFDISVVTCEELETFVVRTNAVNETLFITTGETTNLGVLPYCSAATEYLVYKIDGQSANNYFSGINATFQNGQLSINSGGTEGLQITTSVTTPGIYDSDQFSLQYGGVTIPSAAMQQTYVLNKFGGVGDYIDMVFYGTYTDFTGTHSLTGTAHVLRDQ